MTPNLGSSEDMVQTLPMLMDPNHPEDESPAILSGSPAIVKYPDRVSQTPTLSGGNPGIACGTNKVYQRECPEPQPMGPSDLRVPILLGEC